MLASDGLIRAVVEASREAADKLSEAKSNVEVQHP
jgi:hypothetical protein